MTLDRLACGAVLEPAVEFSRYARRILERGPLLGRTLDTTVPFTAAAMRGPEKMIRIGLPGAG